MSQFRSNSFSLSIRNIGRLWSCLSKTMNQRLKIWKLKSSKFANRFGWHFELLFLLWSLISHYNRASLDEKATYEATVSQLRQDLAAHKNHMQVLANRLDQMHFEVESKCEAFLPPFFFFFFFHNSEIWKEADPEILTLIIVYQIMLKFRIWRNVFWLSKKRKMS